jgi:hypothetical protein
VPSDKQIEKLISPQLPLEGAMLLAGALGDHPATSLREFIHVRLTGAEPPGWNASRNWMLTRWRQKQSRASPRVSRAMTIRRSLIFRAQCRSV